MLVVGYVVVGLAVGADVPASWTLIAETAPTHARGKLGGLAQVFWNIGPLVTLWLALALSPLGELGTRLVFTHLFILAMVTWFLRRRMTESARWEAAAGRASPEQPARSPAQAPEQEPAQAPAFWKNMRVLFHRRYVGAIVFLTVMYGVWNLEAGTGGFYLPYILRTVGGQGQAASVALQSISFFLGLVVLAFVFMPLNDRVNRRVLFAIGAVIQTVGYLLFALFELNTTVALSNVILVGVGGGIGQQVFFQIWSGELFPTMLRSTAQGFMFAVVRIALGIWSFFVPVLAATGFHQLAWILTAFLAISGIVGVIFAPKTGGKSLEQIQAEGDAAFGRQSAG
jgi:inositol transporter-like SP family MFS transporter